MWGFVLGGDGGVVERGYGGVANDARKLVDRSGNPIDQESAGSLFGNQLNSRN